MGLFETKETKDILAIINHLISKNVEISAEIKGSDEPFRTKVVKLKGESEARKLIIEKFYPDTGNSLVQASPEVNFSFEAGERRCFFTTQYLGINTQYPEFGLILDFPTGIQVEDMRAEQRIHNGLAKFISAEFTLKGDTKLYQLKVINLGSHGLGLVVEEEHFDLLDRVEVGDTIKDLRFYLKVATLTVDGIVKHKTAVKTGDLKGNYVLGIQADFVIDLKELEAKLTA